MSNKQIVVFHKNKLLLNTDLCKLVQCDFVSKELLDIQNKFNNIIVIQDILVNDDIFNNFPNIIIIDSKLLASPALFTLVYSLSNDNVQKVYKINLDGTVTEYYSKDEILHKTKNLEVVFNELLKSVKNIHSMQFENPLIHNENMKNNLIALKKYQDSEDVSYKLRNEFKNFLVHLREVNDELENKLHTLVDKFKEFREVVN